MECHRWSCCATSGSTPFMKGCERIRLRALQLPHSTLVSVTSADSPRTTRSALGNYPVRRYTTQANWRETRDTIDLFLEEPQLLKAAYPILGVPRSNYFPVLKFVNVDRLETHLSILRGKGH